MVGEIIQKEEILNYKIVNAPEDLANQLQDKLGEALRLGNTFKSKANIAFNTTEGPKRVETTVWNVTSDFIELKGGIHISTHSLLDVEF